MVLVLHLFFSNSKLKCISKCRVKSVVGLKAVIMLMLFYKSYDILLERIFIALLLWNFVIVQCCTFSRHSVSFWPSSSCGYYIQTFCAYIHTVQLFRYALCCTSSFIPNRERCNICGWLNAVTQMSQ